MRVLRRLLHLFPTVSALVLVGAVVFALIATGGKPKPFAELFGGEREIAEKWCDAHGVPDAICVECHPELLARLPEYGWCKIHGNPECPWCHPDLAQLPQPPFVTAAELERVRQALAFADRNANGSRCKVHQRRIQLASAEVVERIGLEFAAVRQVPMSETIATYGEIVFDPTRVARVGSRLPGVLWSAEKQVGDRVRRGDLLALVEAGDVGKAKAEFLQALAHVDVKTKSLSVLQASPGTVEGNVVREAEAAVEEAQIRLATARQALVNLGLPAEAAEWTGMPPDDMARRMQTLGLPETLVRTFNGAPPSGNLLAVRAPQDGVVISRDAVAGASVDPAKVLFVVADTSRMWLQLQVRLEDAGRLEVGLPVRFRPDGGAEVTGTIAWVSPAADERTRTVAARVELPNPDGQLRHQTFGAGRMVVREEPHALVVPQSAVQSDGDCLLVFVKDKSFDRPGAAKVFHVRKVRVGANENGNVEIIAGVLPGEMVVTAGSGSLRGELLKNDLGAG